MASPELKSYESTAFPLSEQLSPAYLQWALGSLTTKDQVDPSTAGTVLENALMFMKGAASHPKVTLAPSPLVDTGWHRLLLAPRMYLLHNLKTYGVVVWHEPVMVPDVNPATLSPNETFELLEKWGENPDPDVWLGENQDCGGQKCDTCVEIVWTSDHEAAT